MFRVQGGRKSELPGVVGGERGGREGIFERYRGNGRTGGMRCCSVVLMRPHPAFRSQNHSWKTNPAIGSYPLVPRGLVGALQVHVRVASGVFSFRLPRHPTREEGRQHCLGTEHEADLRSLN